MSARRGAFITATFAPSTTVANAFRQTNTFAPNTDQKQTTRNATRRHCKLDGRSVVDALDDATATQAGWRPSWRLWIRNGTSHGLWIRCTLHRTQTPEWVKAKFGLKPEDDDQA